ncbi:MAG: cupredoxin domain-containing protein [Nitrosarchaeum sp.]|nr:cupredoxin domain-containing protein [Nitrosarchaeum sp.]
MTIRGERKFVADNWSMWEAVGELNGSNQEMYSLRFIVTGDDRFSSISPPLSFTVVIPKDNAVQAESSSYIPEKPTVFRGTIVSWVNHDSVTHTVQSQDGKGNVISLFNSDVLQPGQKFDYNFEEPGVYQYLCTLHPWRSGVITVV